MNTELLTVKELAAQLKRGVRYVYAMRALGFKMTGGTATLDEARKWQDQNGSPFTREARCKLLQRIAKRRH